MKYEKVYYYPEEPDVYLEVYAGDLVGGKIRDAMLVIPGGGYTCVCADREGEPIALAFLSEGVQSFVLHYTVKENAVFPRPLAQAMRAMAWIREHAAEYGIDPERVFACGFSAGGHLCASLGTMWHLPEMAKAAGIPADMAKPRGIVPVYPVISADTATHLESFYNILGTTPTAEELALYSLNRRVDEHTPPVYLIHSSDDSCVPVGNSLIFAQALAAHGKKFELHVFETVPHGMALANTVTDCGIVAWDVPAADHWTCGVVEWMKKQ